MDDKPTFTDLEWLEASRANLLKIRKRQQAELSDARATIAEQAEALEGYRKLIVATGIEDLSYGMTAEYDEGSLKRHLPAHEIAELRKRGVEIGEVDGGDETP